jgi:putative tryptophan/tyrosine transport system substrate-binding protein
VANLLASAMFSKKGCYGTDRNNLAFAYNASFAEAFRTTALLVVKILEGAKPADLPVEQPTTFDLVINLKTAKTLGIDVPATLLARADDVIE